ncbi:MAG: NUDIX hydrolase [Anaerolineales bacterium]|nr:NUDIX hydrolase [Anaerolineales bacterium]
MSSFQDKDFHQTLPTKRMAAGCLFFNEKGELLILDLTYKPWWGIPGGIVEKHESPKAACVREIEEEIGLVCHDLHLLCVDYLPETDARTESLQFVFLGPVLTQADIDQIRLQPDEIGAYQFLPPQAALSLLGNYLRRRVQQVVERPMNSGAIYLEDGQY